MVAAVVMTVWKCTHGKEYVSVIHLYSASFFLNSFGIHFFFCDINLKTIFFT